MLREPAISRAILRQGSTGAGAGYGEEAGREPGREAGDEDRGTPSSRAFDPDRSMVPDFSVLDLDGAN